MKEIEFVAESEKFFGGSEEDFRPVLMLFLICGDRSWRGTSRRFERS